MICINISKSFYLQHTLTMRLFKRYAADTSPQLVSAVPISQDIAATVESNAPETTEKKSKTDVRLEDALPLKDVDTQKESDSSILTRKGRNMISY